MLCQVGSQWCRSGGWCGENSNCVDNLLYNRFRKYVDGCF